jgi:hypothetical protein
MKKGITYFILFLSISCASNNNKDTFYKSSRHSYIYRLPLIKPYEITSRDNGATWILAFQKIQNPCNGVQFLARVGIHDSTIVLYSPNDFSFSGEHPPVWAVIDVLNGVENVFTEEKDYKFYLREKKLGAIDLYDIQKVFELFDKEGKLPDEWPK